MKISTNGVGVLRFLELLFLWGAYRITNFVTGVFFACKDGGWRIGRGNGLSGGKAFRESGRERSRIRDRYRDGDRDDRNH